MGTKINFPGIDFGEVIKKHQQKIYRVVFSLTRNEAVADELVQQTFINAYKGIKKFKGNSSIETWLIRIAVNNTKSFFRKKKFLSFFYIFNNDERETEIEDNLQNTEKTVEGRIITETINKAIEKLPARQKEVFVMKHLDGMSVCEISEVLDIAEGSVKANIFKAVQNMRKYLEDLKNEMQ